MRHRIAGVRQALAAAAGPHPVAIEDRVAASVAQLGLVARLISPALAALTLGLELSPLPAGLWWQDFLGGPYPLSFPPPSPGCAAAQSVGAACDALLSELISPLTEAASRQAAISARVLWGNVASAVNGASEQIARQWPHLATRARHVSGLLFSAPQLRLERNQPGPGFRRSSCCLIYRLAPQREGSTCGDCVLN